MEKDPGINAGKREPLSQEEIRTLLKIIKTVSHGSVTLIIQDGLVIQIDKNEKLRLRKIR